MPRYNVSEALQKVLSPGFGRQYLFVLSQSTYELVNSIFGQVAWDVKTPEQRDVYRLAEMEIKEMANLSDLIDVLNQMVTRQGEMLDTMNNLVSCVCTNGANQTTVVQYGLPPDYHGENPDYLSGAEYNESSPVPEPIRNQGFEGWEGWQDYTCRAVEHIRRASVMMTEELLRITDLPVLTLGLIAAVCGALAIIFAEASMVMLVLAPSLMGQIGAALIAVGQAGAEAARDYLADPSNTVWNRISCIVNDSLTAEEAAVRIAEYIEDTAPPVAIPVLVLYPWKSWVNQVYMGENVNHDPLDVTGIPSRCIDCPDEGGTFKGLGVTDCTLDYWTPQSNCRLFEAGVSCDGDGNAPFIQFYDGIYGKYFSEPVTAESPLFEVYMTGNYRLRYRMAGWSGEEGQATLKIFTDSDDFVDSFTVTADNVDGSLRLTTESIELLAGVQYYMTLEMGKFWLEFDNTALELQ